jgi:hypothetical protein
MSVFFGITTQEHFDSLPPIDTSQSEAWEGDARDAIACIIERREIKLRVIHRDSRDSFAMKTIDYELSKRLEAISNRKFLYALETMARFLDRNITGKWHGGPEKMNNTLCCKSTDWMYALLYDLMDNKPACIAYMRKGDKRGFNTLVQTDDCLYSGAQFSQHLVGWTSHWGFDNCNWDKYEKFIIAVPFMTEFAWKERIINEFKYKTIPSTAELRFSLVEVDDSIIVTETPTARQKRREKTPYDASTKCTVILYKPTFIPSTIYVLDEIYRSLDWDERKKNEYRDRIKGTRGSGDGAGLAFFEHRIPDATSLRFNKEIEHFMHDRGKNIHAPYHYQHIAGLGGLTTPRPLACEEAHQSLGM